MLYDSHAEEEEKREVPPYISGEWMREPYHKSQMDHKSQTGERLHLSLGWRAMAMRHILLETVWKYTLKIL